MALKFTQITASIANFTTTDVLIGVQNSTSDRTWTLPQIASGILTSPLITGHATIEGVTLTGVTGTGTLVLDHSPTIGTAILNNAILNTATINTGIFNNATLATATINTATINNATLNTAVLNTATLNAPTLNNGIINAPIVNNPVLSTATINTATLNNAVINTATINTGILNNVTLNTATINSSVIANATLNTSTLNTAVINNATLGTATINTATITNATIASSTINLLNTLTASQLGSAVDTTSLTSRFVRYRITFENVCPVATATLTCSLNMQIATTGVAWVSANYVSTLMGNAVTTTFIVGTTSLFYLSGLTATTCVGTSTNYGVNGWLDITNPANTVFRKAINGHLNYITPGAVSTLTHAEVFPSGFWDGGANAITGIAISFQTGNIATGTFRIYGIS